MSENDKIRVGKYGIDLGERGKYDVRNKLNNLTGKEWVYFTNSVWITGYSPTAIENVGLKFRKIHPSPKPPGLIKDIIRFFTKSNSKILDPFVGVGGTLLGTALAGEKRRAIGIDLEKKYKKAYQRVCKEDKLTEMIYLIGDSDKVLNKREVFGRKKFDLIIADPPYWDMMNKNRTGQKVKLYKNNDSTPFTSKNSDLGNMSFDLYKTQLKNIIEKSIRYLNDKKYLVIFSKDFQPAAKNTNLLHCEIIKLISSIDTLYYKGMRIWHDQAMSLYPFGYPYSFVMNQIHQYILIFRKENNVKK